ncbi:MAG: NADH-quinone oxidoreductase subunit F, partial [Dehalococcoidia bacterium]
MSIKREIKILQKADDLKILRTKLTAGKSTPIPSISLCAGTGCRAAGSDEVRDAFAKEIKKQKLQVNVQLKETGCHGFCEQGPIVVIGPKRIFYQRVQPEDIPEIISETVVKGNVIERLLYVDPLTDKKIIYEPDISFYKKQTRIILSANGEIVPTEIDDYIAIDGYSALSKVLQKMSPDEVIGEVKKSGLRGRGGAGFSTGGKWELCRKAKGDVKYVICNA